MKRKLGSKLILNALVAAALLAAVQALAFAAGSAGSAQAPAADTTPTPPAPPAAAQAPASAPVPEAFTGFAVHSGGNVAAPKSGVVDIVIERWSTPEERASLLAAFKEKGQDGLLAALQRQKPTGYIKFPEQLRYKLYYCGQKPLENGGRNIFLATDRKIQSLEFNRGNRSLDYPFTLIQLRVDKDGSGEGKASIATKISTNKDGQLELEDYSMQPVQINKLKRLKK